MSHSPLITAAELLDRPDDGFRYELVQGALRQRTPAGSRHGRIANQLAWQLSHYVYQHELGEVFAAETGFLLATDPDLVRAPDVAFVTRARIDAVGETDGYWPGAPDLVAEVVSPFDRHPEVHEKVLGWLDAGSRLVWVVEPRTRTVTVYRSPAEIVVLSETASLDGADVVPGWTLPVATLFR